MNELPAMGDGHLLEALKTELNAEVRRAVDRHEAQVDLSKLDADLWDPVSDAHDDYVPEVSGPAIQPNGETESS
jgi:phage baseplate assembly protein W